MNIFIQFVSFGQGMEQLKLFELARGLFGDEPVKEHYTWVGLNGRVNAVDALTKLCEIATTVKFSQIGYSAKFKPRTIFPGAVLKDAIGVLQIPGTSSLWAGPQYWERSSVPSAYRRARSAKRTVFAIAKSKVSAFPAVMEVTLRISAKLRQDQLVDAFATWISQSLDCDAVPNFVCGVADCGDNMLFNKIEILNLAAAEYSIVFFLHGFILGTPLLATRIDRLHRILIHKRKLLSNIAERLGLSKPLKLRGELAVLAIPKTLLEDPASELRISKFTIPKDESTSWAGMVEREGKN